MTQAPAHCDLCVQRTPDNAGWRVIVCDRSEPGRMLGRFDSFTEAADFAIQERDRRADSPQPVVNIHFPDDCPCYRGGICPDPQE